MNARTETWPDGPFEIVPTSQTLAMCNVCGTTRTAAANYRRSCLRCATCGKQTNHARPGSNVSGDRAERINANSSKDLVAFMRDVSRLESLGVEVRLDEEGVAGGLVEFRRSETTGKTSVHFQARLGIAVRRWLMDSVWQWLRGEQPFGPVLLDEDDEEEYRAFHHTRESAALNALILADELAIEKALAEVTR